MKDDGTGIVTALVTQKRNKSRVNVYIDGEFAFGIAAIHAARLHKGQNLTPQEIQELEHLDAVEVAYERALSLLSYRPRSEWEIRQRLEKKAKQDFPPDVLDDVVERLQRVGLLDDEEFARYWVNNRQQFKPRSKRALRYELRRKGVANAVIDAALEAVDDDDAALEAARKRASRLAGSDWETFRKKLGGFLARRGFTYDVSREVVDRLWQEYATEAAGDFDDT